MAAHGRGQLLRACSSARLQPHRMRIVPQPAVGSTVLRMHHTLRRRCRVRPRSAGACWRTRGARPLPRPTGRRWARSARRCLIRRSRSCWRARPSRGRPPAATGRASLGLCAWLAFILLESSSLKSLGCIELKIFPVSGQWLQAGRCCESFEERGECASSFQCAGQKLHRLCEGMCEFCKHGGEGRGRKGVCIALPQPGHPTPGGGGSPAEAPARLQPPGRRCGHARSLRRGCGASPAGLQGLPSLFCAALIVASCILSYRCAGMPDCTLHVPHAQGPFLSAVNVCWCRLRWRPDLCTRSRPADGDGVTSILKVSKIYP